jgi:hypothetical protein
MFSLHSCFAALLVCGFAAFSTTTTLAVAQTDSTQPPSAKLQLKADVLLTPEFCTTKFKKGSWKTIKEEFALGPTACDDIESGLAGVFSRLTRVQKNPIPLDAQVLLTPRFVDVAATTGVTAFSSRDLVIVMEWTAKDASGNTVWIDTVQGSATHHMGNVFTYTKNRNRIVTDSVKDAVAKRHRRWRRRPTYGALPNDLAYKTPLFSSSAPPIALPIPSSTTADRSFASQAPASAAVSLRR